MEQNFKKLNIMLSVCLALFIIPWVLIPYKIVTIPQSMSVPILMTALLFGLLYYVVLGIIAAKKNRSVVMWVGLSFIASPIGHIVSFPLILSAKSLPKK